MNISRSNDAENNNSPIEIRQQRMANLEIVLQQLPITSKSSGLCKAVNFVSDRISKQKRLRHLGH